MGVKLRLAGALAAVAMLAIDQGHKFWMLFRFDIADRQPVAVTPWLDLVLAWNPGISYSLLSASTQTGRLLLLLVALAATLALCVWLWFARTRAVALALGLIIGGALGNAWDRFAYGAVADFFLFHWGSFSWYIFNLADCGIVAGVAVLLYDAMRSKPSEQPQSQ